MIVGKCFSWVTLNVRVVFVITTFIYENFIKSKSHENVKNFSCEYYTYLLHNVIIRDAR